jgi:tol-pal system protein YbgF
MMRFLMRAVPALALVAGTGCFATRSDLAVLQSDLAATRGELLKADSARRAQLDRVIASMSSTQDTLRSMNRRFTDFQAGVRTNLENYGDQLIRVQSLLGVSQDELRRIRADIDRSRATGVAAPTAPAGATPPAGGAATPPANPAPTDPSASAGTPGPAQLFDVGRQQIQRGSPAAGRQALQDLLTNYPDHDLAPDALFYVAEAYAAEENEAAADSAWVEVYTKYPRSQRAAEAMYRHGVVLENGGRTREARRVYQEVISKYARSDAAKLAQGRMQNLP